jgi:hypothetical protein
MGGAEGTKLDLDFMEMERVSELLRRSSTQNYFQLLPFPENGRHSGAHRRIADENQRIPSAKSNGAR